MLHIALHFVLPLIIARFFFRHHTGRAYLMMVATMIVDADHLLATPIYDASRCSIGFHPLHSIIPIFIYALLTISAKTRLVGLGLIIHMLLDALDCYQNTGLFSSA